jgi:cyclopropane-fatty-acyl-phospholipid synthase
VNSPQQLTASPAEAGATSAPPRSLAARTFFKVLSRISIGRLTVTTPDGNCRVFAGTEPGPMADLEIRDWKALGRIVRGAEIGVAECWRDGLIATSDMTAFLEVCVANEKALAEVFYGNPFVALFFRLSHLLRPNTRSGSRRNIHAHYDLGNAFYGLWLDRTMTYSAGLFAQGHGDSLEAAQEAKYERLLDTLGVNASHHVLEIGCGWGGFAEYAARTRGCRVTGVTISRAQLDFARERIRAAGLEDLVELRFQDYRDLEGQFDRIVSIEMFEAVGERWWPQYFRTVHDRLKPGGRAAIQAITIDEAAFERYRRSSDFIREYIFPGGMLASVTRMGEEARAAGLAVHEPFRFGLHYAETLRRWLARVNAAAGEIRSLGFDDRFLALWRFYLHYCEVGFNTGRTDVIHLEVERPA